MRVPVSSALVLTVAWSAADAQQQRPTRFWNLTRHTISELSLAPAGSTNWGPNQCKNDKDGTVDPDERLRITGVPPGTYDVGSKDVSGRVCIVRGIKVEAGEHLLHRGEGADVLRISVGSLPCGAPPR